MRKLVAILGCFALLGCGFSSAEVSLGDALTIGVHHSPSGRTSVAILTAAKTCSAAAVSLAWDDLAARFDRC